MEIERPSSLAPLGGHRLRSLVGQSHGDELGQTGTVLVEDPESGIAGAGHGPGLLGNVAEQCGEIQVPFDKERRLEDPAKLGGIIDGAVRHKDTV